VVIHRNSWGGWLENASEDMMPLGVIFTDIGLGEKVSGFWCRFWSTQVFLCGALFPFEVRLLVLCLCLALPMMHARSQSLLTSKPPPWLILVP